MRAQVGTGQEGNVGSLLFPSSAPWATFEPQGMMLKALLPRVLSCGGKAVLLRGPQDTLPVFEDT